MSSSLPGTLNQNDITDQQCQDCGRWFDNSGIAGHRENCLIAENPYFRYNDEEETLEKRQCGICGGMVPWDAEPDDEKYHETPCPLP